MCYRDATREALVLDVHNSVEVGGLVDLTNATRSRMKGSDSERVTITCNVDEAEGKVLRETRNNLGHLVIM